MAPLYHSGAGGSPGGPKCTPCEMTKLICQAPYSPTGDPPCTFPTPVTDVKVSLPFTGEITEKEGAKDKIVMEDQSKGSGEPEEVSEEDENSGSVSPLLAGSCVCVIPIHEPLEVGENEDCSQAVSPGTPGACSCGGLDADESGKEGKNDSKRPDKGGESQETVSTNETSAACSVSLSPPFLHMSSVVPPSSPEFCLPLYQAQVRPEFKSHLTDRSAVKQESLYRLTSTDSTSTENSTASAMTLVSSLRTSSSVGDLYLDKPTEVSGSQEGQGISWADSRENKLSSGLSELECSPESLHSQLAEPTLTSGMGSY